MARKKLTRRELVQKDEITSTLEQVTTFAVENRKPLLTIVAVIVVAATVLVGWNIFAANREANAQSALSEVIRLYTDTTLAEGEERFQATLTEVQRVSSRVPQSDRGPDCSILRRAQSQRTREQQRGGSPVARIDRLRR